MIAFLKGIVAQKLDDRVYLDVKGVGYDLSVSSKTIENLKKDAEAILFTHMHFSQDMVSLFGFGSEQEKAMFLRLISVSRVGPKLAMASLSLFTPEELATAIVIDDDKTLSRIPGMGRKTAQRLILELKEKIAAEETLDKLDASYGDIGKADIGNEAVAALVALGYDRTSAKRAVMAVDQQQSIQDIIKQAHKRLAK